jgi:hypothetical protein
MKKLNVTVESNTKKIDQELDKDKPPAWKRSKWIKWLLNIVDNIVTALT